MRTLIIGLLATALIAPGALAQEAGKHSGKDWKADKSFYIGGSAGYLWHGESDNGGVTGAFTTGNGSPALPTGTAIAAGTPYGWDTQFEDGMGYGAEAGFRIKNKLRTGLEISYTKSDVDTHSGVTVGTTNIDGVDAAVLTGSATQLGATVGQVVADGRGEISNLAAYANAYYHFDLGRIQPYVGAGIGVSQVEVVYQPSGVRIIDDKKTKFAWQLKAGAEAMINDNWSVYGEYAYRMTEDVEFDNLLFPGTLEIENRPALLSVGVRYTFK